MGENSKIEWTDHTFNPWIGCTKVAAGCKNCYAENLMDSRYGKAQWGPNGTRVLTSPANWRKPIAWNKAAQAEGVRRRVFCASLADVFEDWSGGMLDHQHVSTWRKARDGETPLVGDKVPFRMDDARQNLFGLIDATPWLDWLLLTKRPENVRRMWPRNEVPMGPSEFRRWSSGDVDHDFRHNVWIGTSVATQEDADRNLPELANYSGISRVLFVSAEPLLGPVDLHKALIRFRCWSCKHESLREPQSFLCESCGADDAGSQAFSPAIDWVIVGGESGPGARPMHPDWARSLRDQCQASGVPFLFKQWGEWFPFDHVDDIPPGVKDSAPVCLVKQDGRVFRPYSFAEHAPGVQMIQIGKPKAGRDLDGRTWDEFPQTAEVATR